MSRRHRVVVSAGQYVLMARSGCARRNHGWRWHMFEEKREAVMAIEAAALPLLGCLRGNSRSMRMFPAASD